MGTVGGSSAWVSESRLIGDAGSRGDVFVDNGFDGSRRGSTPAPTGISWSVAGKCYHAAAGSAVARRVVASPAFGVRADPRASTSPKRRELDVRGCHSGDVGGHRRYAAQRVVPPAVDRLTDSANAATAAATNRAARSRSVPPSDAIRRASAIRAGSNNCRPARNRSTRVRSPGEKKRASVVASIDVNTRNGLCSSSSGSVGRNAVDTTERATRVAQIVEADRIHAERREQVATSASSRGLPTRIAPWRSAVTRCAAPSSRLTSALTRRASSRAALRRRTAATKPRRTAHAVARFGRVGSLAHRTRIQCGHERTARRDRPRHCA